MKKYLDILKAAIDVLNGKKLNTGTIVTLMALGIRQIPGVSEDDALNMATYLVMGGGQAIMLWGYIHRWIKDRRAKKAAK